MQSRRTRLAIAGGRQSCRRNTLSFQTRTMRVPPRRRDMVQMQTQGYGRTAGERGWRGSAAEHRPQHGTSFGGSEARGRIRKREVTLRRAEADGGEMNLNENECRAASASLRFGAEIDSSAQAVSSRVTRQPDAERPPHPIPLSGCTSSPPILPALSHCLPRSPGAEMRLHFSTR